MTSHLISSLVAAAALALSCQAHAQGRRTVALSSVSGVTTKAYLAEEVDNPPCFPGGDRELIRFINSKRRYPEQAYREGVSGRVMCSFIVEADGTVSHVEVIRGVERTLDAEAVRVISSMPKWTPGLIGDTPVATFCLLPIAFRR